MYEVRLDPNFWCIGTDGKVRVDVGTMETGIFLCPPDDIRAWEVCPAHCKCGKVVGSGVQASLGTITMRHTAAAERARHGFQTALHFGLMEILRLRERKWQNPCSSTKDWHFHIGCHWYGFTERTKLS